MSGIEQAAHLPTYFNCQTAMKTRLVYTKLWDDGFVNELSPVNKLLFLYFLTNDHTNLCGTYELPRKRILFDTGVTEEQLRKAQEIFTEHKKILFCKDWVMLVNANKYNNYGSSEKTQKPLQRELDEVPADVQSFFQNILRGIDTLSIGYAYPMDSTRNKKSEIRNKKPEERKEKEKKEERTDVSLLNPEQKCVFECFIALGYKDDGTFKAFIEELVVKLPRVDLSRNAEGWKLFFEKKTVKNHKSSFFNWVSKPYAIMRPDGGKAIASSASLEHYSEKWEEKRSRTPEEQKQIVAKWAAQKQRLFGGTTLVQENER